MTVAQSKAHKRDSVYGNLAYDLDALARELQLDEAGTMPEREDVYTPAPRRRSQAAPKAAVSPAVLLGIAVLGALVLALLLGYVQLTQISGQVSHTKSHIAALEDEHISLVTAYEKSFDLATIKRVAEAAGMSKPSSGQIEYIDLGGSDTAVIYRSDSIGAAREAMTSVQAACDWLWEYFR